MTAGAASSTVRLHGWRTAPVLSLALVVIASGFGQFGAVAALGDVAEEFGEVTGEATIAEQAGLSGTVLGVGLALIRLASLGSLPLAALADRRGRRATLVGCCTLGLAFTAAASLSPTYWAFIAVFALSRPLLTATGAVAQVAAAEQTPSADRAKAVALVAAGYGIGSGLVALVRGAGAGPLGFRGVFVLALVPLAGVLVARRWLVEPDRYRAVEAAEEKPIPVLGAVARPFRGRLMVLAALAFAVASITGPANSFLFVYAENILGLSPAVTAAMVVGAGVSGLAGLLAGRWCADRFGRRRSGAVTMAAIAGAGLLTYSGSVLAVIVGYLLAVAAGSAFAPSAGSLSAELFPTEIRATVAGWVVAAGVLGGAAGLLAFGAVADAGGRFSLAATAVFVPAAAASVLFALLPETRGRELEEWDRL